MRFFNLDLHISVIQDIATLFGEMGHEVDSKSISGHSWVFGKSADHVEIINQNSWKQIDQKLADKFYERYKDELSEYDGFIVTHTPVFAILFEKFDKPIITVASTRYEAPYSNDKEKWRWFNSKLKSMIDRNQIIPIANNKYDKYYCEYFLEREWKHIPSICSYTKSKYNFKKEEFIFSGKVNLSQEKIIHIKSLGRHTWEDLYSYKGIIHLPYNMSLMSVFEQYTANVPLFFPSKELAIRLPSFLSEIFYPSSFLRTEFEEVSNYETKLDLADYYDDEWMPHIQYFNSQDELDDMLEKDFHEVSDDMEKFNKDRIAKVKNLWQEVIGAL